MLILDNITSNETFQSYQDKIIALIWDIQLSNYISNIIAFCLDGRGIQDIFWKRLIVWEDTDVDKINVRLRKMLDTESWINYEFDILSYFKAEPWLLKDRFEDWFNDEKHAVHITKYKDIKICCFKCPYKWRHTNLEDPQCWNKKCPLYDNQN